MDNQIHEPVTIDVFEGCLWRALPFELNRGARQCYREGIYLPHVECRAAEDGDRDIAVARDIDRVREAAGLDVYRHFNAWRERGYREQVYLEIPVRDQVYS